MRLIADLHVHTIASGHAYATINEYIQAAKAKGLEMIAITDHGPALPGGPDISYFGYLAILPEEQDGVQILTGVEANILDIHGKLDMTDRYLERLDIVLAGLHPPCYRCDDEVQNTKAVINTMKNPLVDIIVHPGNPTFPINIEEVLAASREYNCLLEINNSSLSGGARRGSRVNCLEIAKVMAREKMPVVLGSDAHYIDRMGSFEAALDLLKEAGISEEMVLNTSVDKICNFLKENGKGKPFRY
ncbi:MAG: phosphatase [Clostridia bacterium]|nr:phosphatase [Clostridia bacterium]